MLVLKRRETRYVFVVYTKGGLSQVFDRCVHVDRVPENHRVDHEPKCSELVLLALSVGLANLSSSSVKGRPCKFVAALVAVELGEDPTPVRLVVDVGEKVKRFRDSTEVPDAFRQCGRSVASQQ